MKSENKLIKTKNKEINHGVTGLLIYIIDINSLYLFILKLFKNIIKEIR